MHYGLLAVLIINILIRSRNCSVEGLGCNKRCGLLITVILTLDTFLRTQNKLTKDKPLELATRGKGFVTLTWSPSYCVS